MNYILRRRKLGRTSCREISNKSTTGIGVVRNDRALPAGEIVFRWGCTSTIPGNPTVVNSAASIHWCSDKRQGRLDMQEAGVSVPETWAAEDWLQKYEDGEEFGGAYVLRPRHHAQGRWLSSGTAELVSCDADRSSYLDGYVSRLINKVAEYRVAVIQNRVAWVARKTPGNPDDVAWNVAQGGRFDNVRWGEWPMQVIAEALKAARCSGTDFCGVDVMVDAGGAAFVLEVNSAPSLTSDYRQSCFAKCFDWIVTNGKQAFAETSPDTWRDVIHPALLP